MSDAPQKRPWFQFHLSTAFAEARPGHPLAVRGQDQMRPTAGRSLTGCCFGLGLNYGKLPPHFPWLSTASRHNLR